MLEKVFLALRTDFIPELITEHITLAYFYEIRWDALLDIAEKYDKMLPATIHLYGKMQWEAGGQKYQGFDVASHDSNILRMLRMPHITVPKPMLDKIQPRDLDSVQIVDRLYLGKKVNNQLIWATVKNDQIGPGNAALNFPELTGNPNWDKL
jgi:hypothetical protein